MQKSIFRPVGIPYSLYPFFALDVAHCASRANQCIAPTARTIVSVRGLKMDHSSGSGLSSGIAAFPKASAKEWPTASPTSLESPAVALATAATEAVLLARADLDREPGTSQRLMQRFQPPLCSGCLWYHASSP